jgi:Flp pilus assembly protein TadG
MSRERGAGLLGTAFGLLVFLLLLLFAVQVVHGLYATSVVTGVAYDAARTVAGHDGASDRAAAASAAEAILRSRLPAYGPDRLELSWRGLDGGDAVTLTVRARHRTVWPRGLDPAGLATTERTVTVRAEEDR